MSYANNNYYKKGSWNVICDVCGSKYKADEVKKRWDGLIVCAQDWETDHPQKFLRVQSDPKQVPFIRTEPADVFVDVCNAWTSVGMADFGTADCSSADRYLPIPYLIELFYPDTSSISGIAIASYSVSGVI